MNIRGLGDPPPTIQSVSDLLLFNTDINVYRSHDTTIDSLNNKIDDEDDDYKHGFKDDTMILSDAPISVTDGDSLPIVALNEIGFKPTLGPVPELQLPSELPELSMAANISWGGDAENPEMATIAPSAMAEALPDLDFSVGNADESGEESSKERLSGTPPPPPPPLLPPAAPPPPPPPPPHADVPVAGQPHTQSTLPETPAKAPQAETSTPSPPLPAPSTDSGRSALLEQIRNPGMTLRKVIVNSTDLDNADTDDNGTSGGGSEQARPTSSPLDPHSALMAAVLSKNTLKKADPAASNSNSEGNAQSNTETAATSTSSTKFVAEKDPHSDLMSAIKNRGSISLKSANDPSRQQRSQSLPPNKEGGGDIMSQLADDLKKRRVSIAVRMIVRLEEMNIRYLVLN